MTRLACFFALLIKFTGDTTSVLNDLNDFRVLNVYITAAMMAKARE